MNNPRFAIVGGSSLLGKELRDVFEALPKAVDLKLIGAEEGETVGLTEDAGEAVVVSPLDEENLVGATVVILAGSPDSTRRAWDLLALRKNRPFVIDLSGALATVPGAQLRAPSVEAAVFEVNRDAVQVIAHPAAVALAILFRRLQGMAPVRRVVANAFVPASELGNAGVDELHRQTVSLFGFQDMPKQVFDEQVAFNMVARWGEEASAGKLVDTERRIRGELDTLVASAAGMPALSLRAIQTPVFHGLSFSLWMEFGEILDPAAMEKQLRGDLVDVWDTEQGVPSNRSVAGEAGISVGDLRKDDSHPNAVWAWMVADNLRLRAANAIGAARIWLS